MGLPVLSFKILNAIQGSLSDSERKDMAELFADNPEGEAFLLQNAVLKRAALRVKNKDLWDQIVRLETDQLAKFSQQGD